MTVRTVAACSFEADYTWSGFGGSGMSAYGIVSLSLRTPGQADVLLTFSQQADSPAGATPKAGELVYPFADEAALITSASPQSGATLVIKGALFAEKAHYGIIEIVEARAESAFAIPAACLL